MDTQIYLTNLYDYYKELLTEKQRRTFEDYYFDNLTMEEIAENNEISKNAVSKTLMETKEKLESFENSLNLYDNYQSITKLVDDETLKKIEDYI